MVQREDAPPEQTDEWDKFRSRLSRVQQFKDLGLGARKDPSRLEEALRLCWEMCGNDRARLQKRLDELNLDTLKQVSALRSQLSLVTGRPGRFANYTEHNIEFYEPLNYLSETARELVLRVVDDRLQQREPKEAPSNATVDTQEADERARKAEERDAKSKAALEKIKQELDAGRAELRAVRARLMQMEEESAELEKQKRELQQENARLLERLVAAQVRITQLEDETARLQEEKRQMEQELATSRARLQELQEELAAVREELASATARLEQALQETERLRGLCAALEAHARELELRTQELEGRLREAEAQLHEARAEADALRARCKELQAQASAAEARAEAAEAELARRNDTRTRAVQTEVTGGQDGLRAENQRLQNLVEELRSKIADLMSGLDKQGLGQVARAISKEVGLNPIFKAKTCFQRLYDDAIEREHRMERLRQEQATAKREALEHRFNTWDQELADAVQCEHFLLAEQRSKELQGLHDPQSPPKGRGQGLPQLQAASPRASVCACAPFGAGQRDSWRPMPPPRASIALDFFGETAGSSREALAPQVSMRLSTVACAAEGVTRAEMSSVLQPPCFRSYTSPRRL